ncbi:MAG: yvcT [Anaerocolumna sp.]|jgi:phosphoglycerate dehydrogenase-like enzyme|nr:yvcT [Anaerocolumna sp.]
MGKKSILLIQNTTEEQIATIQKIAPDYEILKGWEDNGQKSFDDVEILYGWNFNIGPQILNHPSSKLKWIQSHTAGIDYMDLASLKDKGISLTTSSGIHALSIAESVFGMLLSYVRGIGNSIKNQGKKEWASPKQIMELNQSTIMIVGTGNIGVQVGRLAKAFGMETIGVNRSGNSVEYMDTVIKQTQLMDYINQADFVVNIMPLTDLTRYYFNKDVFSKMKEGSAFINVGRGQTVQVDDLMDALDHGILAFAGLDVFEKEPLPKDSPLWEREDVLITPHISGLIKHFKSRLFVIFEENLRAYIEEKELPRNKVDYNRSY